jgi:ERCC4-type nuclease
MTIMVSSAEPASLRTLGTYSPLPEQFGADFLIPCPIGMVGVQRKEIHDLIASRADGRLARELAQMKQLDVGILLVEGRLKWTSDGELSTSRSKWTRAMHTGLLLSVQSTGIWVNSSESIAESREYLSQAEAWFSKETHKGLNTRPKPTTLWGNRTDRDWGIHTIQSVDGVGPEMAGRIFDKFGLPFTCRVTVEELMTVDGVGRKRAEKIVKAFNG